MLQQVKQWMSRNQVDVATPRAADELPLDALCLGAEILFAQDAPAPLCGVRMHVVGLQSYVFDGQIIESFRLKANGIPTIQLVVAEDEQGYYLALSRLISLHELNALLPQRAKAEAEQAPLELPDEITDGNVWFAKRYTTRLKEVEGSVYVGRINDAEAGRMGRNFTYTLYSSDAEDAAIEMEEHNDGTFQLACTLFRDAIIVEELVIPASEDTPLLLEEPRPYTPHLHAVPSLVEDAQTLAEWLDEPESVPLGFSSHVALGVLNDALYSGQRISDILRDQVGLDVLGKEEVALTMHLSEADYKALAQRYQMKASNKHAIHKKLQEEISSYYLGVKVHGR